MVDTKYANQQLAEDLSEIILELERDCIDFEDNILVSKDTIKSKVEDTLLYLLLILDDDNKYVSAKRRATQDKINSVITQASKMADRLNKLGLTEYAKFYKSMSKRINLSEIDIAKIKMMLSIDEYLISVEKDLPKFLEDINKKTKDKLMELLALIDDDTKSEYDLSFIIRARELFYFGLDIFIQQIIVSNISKANAKDLIGKRVNRVFNSIEANVRTKLTEAINLGIFDMIKSNKIKEFEFCAILDSRTSEICRGMDGKIFKVSDGEVGINIPPLHHRCRSFIVPIEE